MGELGRSVQCQKSIYHFLSGTLGEEITVAQVVDLDILDVVSIVHIHLTVQRRCRGGVSAGGRGRIARGRARRLDRWNIDVLYPFARLELGIDSSRGRRCNVVSHHWNLSRFFLGCPGRGGREGDLFSSYQRQRQRQQRASWVRLPPRLDRRYEGCVRAVQTSVLPESGSVDQNATS